MDINLYNVVVVTSNTMSFLIGETVGCLLDTQTEYVVLSKFGDGWNTQYHITPKSKFGLPSGDTKLNKTVSQKELYFPCREFYTTDYYMTRAMK